MSERVDIFPVDHVLKDIDNACQGRDDQGLKRLASDVRKLIMDSDGQLEETAKALDILKERLKLAPNIELLRLIQRTIDEAQRVIASETDGRYASLLIEFSRIFERIRQGVEDEPDLFEEGEVVAPPKNDGDLRAWLESCEVKVNGRNALIRDYRDLIAMTFRSVSETNEYDKFAEIAPNNRLLDVVRQGQNRKNERRRRAEEERRQREEEERQRREEAERRRREEQERRQREEEERRRRDEEERRKEREMEEPSEEERGHEEVALQQDAGKELERPSCPSCESDKNHGMVTDRKPESSPPRTPSRVRKSKGPLKKPSERTRVILKTTASSSRVRLGRTSGCDSVKPSPSVSEKELSDSMSKVFSCLPGYVYIISFVLCLVAAFFVIKWLWQLVCYLVIHWIVTLPIVLSLFLLWLIVHCLKKRRGLSDNVDFDEDDDEAVEGDDGDE